MRRRLAALAAAFLLPVGAWAGAAVPATASDAARADGSSAVTASTESFARRVLATGLANPFEVVVGGDGRLWVTERSAGRVTQVDPSTGAKRTVLTVAGSTSVGQSGLLGMALVGRQTGGGPRYVYLSYTYDRNSSADVVDLRQRLARYTYDAGARRLHSPRVLLQDLPASDDHNSGRLVRRPDGTLLYSLGDQGANHGNNACRPNLALRLPTATEVSARNWVAYQGKTLRLRVDGSVPADNPVLAGVRSHVWTYGHRNHQGLAVAGDGQVYSSEHGPTSDDELNRLVAGGNYGWPRIAGFRDDSAYAYADWSARASGCDPADYDALTVPDDVPQQQETSYGASDLVAPVRTFFTVPPDYDFVAESERCSPRRFICYPTVAPSSLDVYRSSAVPGWNGSFLMPTLKSGVLLRLPVAGTTVGDPQELFRSVNRYRDVAVSGNGRVVYVATDTSGVAADLDGLPTTTLENPGAILAFRYTG